MLKRMLALEIILIVVSIVIILFFAPSMNAISVTEFNQGVSMGNKSDGLVFNLTAGQSVIGSLNYTGDISGAWFTIYDPNGNPMVTSPTYYNPTYHENNVTGVSFSFTANVDGKYYGSVAVEKLLGGHIDYSYTISPPRIIGLFVGLTIMIAIILTITNIYLNLHRIKKEKPSQ